ncbi:MAG TPA: hypothetical protein VEC56_02665 [Candidatus Krumholzibacteria bacterium]|nr:hypothetical protein [Candidatus Krumholzibacteria bacterium]
MIITRFAAVAGFLALSACDPLDSEDERPCVCTDQFVSVLFWAVDSLQTPQDSFVVTVRNHRNGETYDVPQPTWGVGVYRAIDDSFTRRVSNGDPIQVTGERGARSFDAQFLIGVDDCQCHVHKISGPDTVVIENP